MGDMIVMSQKELQRCRVLRLVLGGRLTLRKASELMGVSYRHARRLKWRYERYGEEGLAHGNRGRPPPNKVGDDLRSRVLELSQEKYADFNDSHFCEMLFEDEGIRLSRDTVRRMRRNAGIKSKRRRRAKHHRKRRERKPVRGQMMLWDGSPHPWFGEEKPPCCLMAAMDDATGRILAGRFEPSETSLGYMRLLRAVVTTHGIPASVYQDGHSALERNDDHWSLEEQLKGEQEPTQVGCALRGLGVERIRALSPQAKGRIERLFGVLQDRMIAEMRLAGIDNMEEANRWLAGFIERYNARFAVSASERGSLFRKAGRMDVEGIISFRYERVVGNDNTVSVGGLVIDIPPGTCGRGYAKSRVEVRQLLDGSWRVCHKGKIIATHPATPLNSPVRGRAKRKAKGAAEWVWVYRSSAPGPTETRP